MHSFVVTGLGWPIWLLVTRLLTLVANSQRCRHDLRERGQPKLTQPLSQLIGERR